MSDRMIKAYIDICEVCGREPTFEGAMAFKWQVKTGVRCPVTYERKGN